MVRIERADPNFIFEVVGWHKLWTFTNRLIIPATHIIDAYPNKQRLDFIRGIRMFGTGLPGFIAAGTYWAQGEIIFCDVLNQDKSICVELRDEYYRILVIEVEDIYAAIQILMKR